MNIGNSMRHGSRQQIILTQGSGVLEREINRLRIQDVVVVVTGSEAPQVVKRIGAPVSHVIQIELVEASIAGVPLTGGVPNYDYLSVKLENFGYDSVWTAAGNDGLPVFVLGERTSHKYTDRVLVQSESPAVMRDVRIALSKPDGTIATSSDFSTLMLVFRVTYDLDARRVY